jgi:hypothetical protein
MSDELSPFRQRTRAEFELWLANEVEVREELEQLMGTTLEFDFDSLDVVESFLLERYPTLEAALKLDARPVLDAAARHVGLVMVLNLEGAHWELQLEPDAMYLGLPIIRLADGAEECPLSMTTAALDRRSGSYLHGVVEAYADDTSS